MTQGYAPVNGLRMYYEVHGTGRPLVLLHGGLMTIDLSFGAVWPELAADHQVIATELQGHGRTADIDRDIDLRYLAGDVAALLDHLGVGQADVLGFSLGGGVALQLALDHPDRVGRIILASVSYASDGFHAEISDPAQHATSTRMPTAEDFLQMREAYARLAPDPGHFEAFAAKTSQAAGSLKGWTAAELGPHRRAHAARLRRPRLHPPGACGRDARADPGRAARGPARRHAHGRHAADRPHRAAGPRFPRLSQLGTVSTGAVSRARPAGRGGRGAAPGAPPRRRPDRAARGTRPR